jgi:hypothetical protein
VVPKDADVDGEVRELKSAGHFDEYTREGNSRGRRTAETVGGGAAVGALIGGLTGGGKGAAIGAGIGQVPALACRA